MHLLQQALIEVLGDHISQHGSYVTDEYSHFDFNHFQKVSAEQLSEVAILEKKPLLEGKNMFIILAPNNK